MTRGVCQNILLGCVTVLGDSFPPKKVLNQTKIDKFDVKHFSIHEVILGLQD